MMMMQYMWEVEGEQALLKKIKKDQNASYYPTAHQVLYNPYFSKSGNAYKLAYKVEVYAKSPLSKQDVFVDASTGNIINAYNKLHHVEVTGTANTKYSGVQSIQTDSTGVAAYRLREYARGGGIETYNMLQGTNYSAAVDFTDTDNIWNNVNAQQDEAATDAHWAAEMTYDYFMLEHGRNSYDNAGSTLLSYVHYDANYANAFWDGVRMSYGDGDGTNYTALTSLDVGGHEIAHGVTEYAANLVYQAEPGALNESFSDIFGTAIEFYADPGNADWFIGEDFDINGNGFRSMSDPNSVGDPDTYFGANWASLTGPDNGGVHTNSSVQNYWFYLLTVGGTGTNDNNDAYNVTGLGIDTAAAIAYRNLTVYLTQSSEYWDARMGALQAAADLYGPCSNAVIETSKAWAAVGVGFPIEDNDLTIIALDNPTTACGLTNAENVTIQIRNNGCLVDLLAGDSIPVAYQVNANPVVHDTIVLATTFAGGDTLTYTFSTTADLSVVGMHNVSAWVDYDLDPQAGNDSLLNVQVEHKLQQNYDMALVEVLSPMSNCHLTNAEVVNVAVQFLGCDSLPAGTNVDLEYQLNAGPVVNETVTLANTLYAEDTLFYTFTTPVDLSMNGTHNLDVWSAYATDAINNNDTLIGFTIKHPYVLFDTDTVKFEDNIAVLDTTILWDNIESNAGVSNASASTGNYALRLTGGDPINSAIIPDLDTVNFWAKNMEFAASAKFCVDATGWTGTWMQFDLRQTMSKVYNLQLGQPVPQASSMRLLVNGNQIGGTYNPATEISDPFTTHSVDLSAYAGTQFELVFESRMGFSEAADPLSSFPFNSEGDNAYIDNILFSQTPLSVNENEIIDNVVVYPNPNKGQFEISFAASNYQVGSIEVIDVLGNLVQQQNIQLQKGYNKVNFDISNQANSIYFVRLVTEKGSYTTRIIKN
jgi:Zn-dependent metalloprotease